MSRKVKVVPFESFFDKYKEVTCSNCQEIFDTRDIITRCPDCGSPVIACNHCDSVACEKCKQGEYFNMYGEDRDTPFADLKDNKNVKAWFDGGDEDGA